jgi:hypothetical protein
VFAFVVCRGERPTGEVAKLVDELRKWVTQELGALARPDDIRFADNLPKTRSGKIMRRLLRSVARGDEITQDVSTLENPGILDQLRGVDTGSTTKLPVLKKAVAKKAKKKVAKKAAKPKPAAKKAKSAPRRKSRPAPKPVARKKARKKSVTRRAPKPKTSRSSRPRRAKRRRAN